MGPLHDEAMESPQVPAVGRIAQLAAVEHALCRLVGRAVVGRPLVALLRIASRYGDWPLSVTVALLLAVAHGHAAFVLWTAASVAAVLLQKTLKVRCARRRPCEMPDGPPQRAPIPDAGSFPSGHTLHAVMAAVVVSQLLPSTAPFFVVVALLIAASRVVLGVHYPSDVAAGASIGGLLGAVLCALV